VPDLFERQPPAKEPYRRSGGKEIKTVLFEWLEFQLVAGIQQPRKTS
jgi:hypothetical protein